MEYLEGKELDTISQARIDSPYTGLQFSEISKVPNWISVFKATYGGIPILWRLTQKCADNQNMLEEAVATVQGVIVNKDLPPFTCKINSTSGRGRYLRQSISLVGFGSTHFNNSISQIARTHSLFERSIGRDKLARCEIVGEYRGFPTVNISNRYFTSRLDAQGAEEIPFSSDIDPYGYLQNSAGDTLIHCEDNTVRYYERILSPSTDEQKFVPTQPMKFQIGDIVEAQISFVAVPIKDKKFKSTLILRSLSLMEGKFTEEANTARILSNTPSAIPQNISMPLKRRTGYAEEEIASARAKLARMDIDGGEIVRGKPATEQPQSENDLD